MKYQSTLQKLIGIAAAGFCLSGMLSVLPVNAESAPPDAVGAVTASGKTTYYYDTIESGGASAMWNEAVAKHNATVTLYADWRAAEDGCFGKDGGGFVNGGVICVPTGCEITIDLNGFSVDRALDSAIDNGEVLCIQEGGSLYLSDTKSGNTGKLCGGNSTSGAGGIFVEPGASLNLWGGSITGNKTDGNGGGIMLGGSGASLNMTGGIVTGNSASQNGGGLASVDGTIRIIGGQFTKNRASGSGGGIYLQGGSAEIMTFSLESNSAATGGGLSINSDAVLNLKDGSVIQKNIAHSPDVPWGGGGILDMSNVPIQVSGVVTISGNLLSNGDTSNLSFYSDKNGTFTGSRIENAGLNTSSSAIGVSYTGGKNEYTFAYGWSGDNLFTMDTPDFTMKEKDGNLTLHRSFQGLSTIAILVILGILVIAIIVLLLVLSASKRKKKKKKRKKKSTKQA